ncbi:PIN-like domain-containing protein [Bacillus subtilis]|uniref:PIN domain-containing protein n=1 Tax=Bacillus subtilis TaxID=1423 RepID=UPI003512F0DA
MKNLFSGFYKLNQNELTELWENGLFVFDTNILLNPFRYQSSASDVLLHVFHKLKERTWIPYQVAMEYHFQVDEIIIKQKSAYGSLIESLGKKVNQLEEAFKKQSLSHTNLKLSANLHDKYKQVIDELIQDLEKQQGEHPDLFPLKNYVLEIFTGRIGNPYSQKEIDDIYKEGEFRYSEKIPPGFEDLKQKKDQKKYFDGIHYQDVYGDLVMWNQIIDHAKETGKDIIFISDDNKKDWIREVEGKKIGPQPELIQEFHRNTCRKIHFYSAYKFLSDISNYITLDKTKEEIEAALESIGQFIEKEEESSNDEVKYKSFLIKNMEGDYIKENSDYLAVPSETEINLNSVTDSNAKLLNEIRYNMRRLYNDKFDKLKTYFLIVIGYKTDVNIIRKVIFNVHQELYNTLPISVKATEDTIVKNDGYLTMSFYMKSYEEINSLNFANEFENKIFDKNIDAQIVDISKRN